MVHFAHWDALDSACGRKHNSGHKYCCTYGYIHMLIFCTYILRSNFFLVKGGQYAYALFLFCFSRSVAPIFFTPLKNGGGGCCSRRWATPFVWNHRCPRTRSWSWWPRGCCSRSSPGTRCWKSTRMCSSTRCAPLPPTQILFSSKNYSGRLGPLYWNKVLTQ